MMISCWFLDLPVAERKYLKRGGVSSLTVLEITFMMEMVQEVVFFMVVILILAANVEAA